MAPLGSPTVSSAPGREEADEAVGGPRGLALKQQFDFQME